MRVQYLSIITGACRARVASTSVFTRVHPVQPDHPFWTKLFYRSTILYNLLYLLVVFLQITVDLNHVTRYSPE